MTDGKDGTACAPFAFIRLQDACLPSPEFAMVNGATAPDITLSKMSAGVLPYGAVSSSGFGDGGYTCYTHADENGVIDFAFIVFI